jgi:hypothetical protein
MDGDRAVAKLKKTWRRRAVAAFSALALGVGGAVLTAVPASATVFNVVDEAGFLVAIAAANANPDADTINVNVPGGTVFDYNGSLPVDEELIINGPGSALFTLESLDNDGIDVAAIPFTLNGASVLGGTGHGISAVGSTLVLNDVNVSNSTGGGVNLNGGSLSATDVIANDTNIVGISATGAITAFHLDEVTANGNAARGVSLDTASVTDASLNDVGIDANDIIGLHLVAAGTGTVTDVTVTNSGDTGIYAGGGWTSLSFTDVDADGNGTSGTGNGISYSSSVPAAVSDFERVTADGNDEIGIDASMVGAGASMTMQTVSATGNGSTGMYIEVGGAGSTFDLDDLTVDLNGDNGIDFTAGSSVGTLSNVTASHSTFNGVNLQASGPSGSITATDLNSFENGASGYAFSPASGSTIDVSAGFATDNNTTFVPTYGGGIFASVDNADLNISDFQVTSNEAENGGGIGIDEIVNGGTVDITTTLVNRNEATTDPLASGGGIYIGTIEGADSRFALSDSTVASNTSETFGGGIWLNTVGNDTAIDTVSITRTTIADNSAPFAGGIGIPFLSGIADYAFVLDSSTVSGNQADDAAGLAVQSHAVATISPIVHVVNSTFSGNIATNSAGGMLFNSSSNPSLQVVVEHSTVTLNDGGGTAGGIQVTDDANIDISNTIVQGNVGGDDLVADPAADLETAYDLVGTPDALFAAELASGTGNLVGVSAMLGPLALNGGPTFTHLPSEASPAVDSGDTITTFFPALDQRGLDRVVDRVDMGSVERAAALLALSGTDPAPGVTTALVLLVIGAGALAGARIRRKVSRAS